MKSWCARARSKRQGRSIIHLEIGEPDFPTPAHIVEAAKKALDDGWTHYGPTQGYPELREAMAAYISRTRGIRVGPEHVSIVPGGKPIIFFPMLALLEPGDEVIYPESRVPDLRIDDPTSWARRPCRFRWWRAAASRSTSTCCATGCRTAPRC